MAARSASVVGTAMAVLFGLAACGDGGEEDGGADETGTYHIRYASGTSAPDVAGASYTSLPSTLGFFEDEGVEVEQLNLAGGGLTLQALVTDQADIANSGTSSVFPAVQQGLPIRGFYATQARQYAWPAVLPDSPIESTSDLAGKRIGVPSLESSLVPNAKAYVATAGGDPASLQFIPVGAGADAANALTKGDVDALMLWDSPYALIKAGGQPLRELKDNEAGVNAGYAGTLVAREVALSGEDREAYVRFARAVAKSLVFQRANPTCAIYAHWNAFPASKVAGESDEEALRRALAVWEGREPILADVDGKIGYSDPGMIAAQISLQEAGDLLKTGFEEKDAVDWGLIDSINDFDREEIEELAEACDYSWAPKQ